ncbi:MAG TPA: S8 family serine peptidase, partial [Pyrinomonadaceae bacterium]
VSRAGARGVVVVAAAGNAGHDNDAAPHYPASFDLPNVISVASTDGADRLAGWSNWGAARVQVAAPGDGVLTTTRGGGYGVVNGTSASAAVVSGVVGLVKTARPLLRAERVREAVAGGVRKIPELAGKVSAGGVVDAAAALGTAQGWPHDSEFEVAPGEEPPQENNGNGKGAGNGGNGNNGNAEPGPPPRPGRPRQSLPNLDEMRRKLASDPIPRPAPARSKLPDYVRGEPTQVPGETISADWVSTGKYGGSTLSLARLDPSNRTGTPDVDLFSGNYNWSLPLLNLPGRSGLDLSLTLSYNSLVWTKLSYSYMFFDEDQGSPSPGFRLGFPVVQPQFYDEVAGKYAYLLVTPAGARVELRQTATAGVYEAADSSYLQLIDYGSTKLMRDTNGTQYTMTDDGTGRFKCTQVKDRNGNYQTITYTSGRIASITDTLARVINFNYDGNGRLSTITQQRGGATYTWATFGYTNIYVSPNFPGMWVYGPYNQYISVLSNVWVADSSRYDFIYNPFGQVYIIERFAAAGNFLARTSYNLPTTSTAQSDCPRFSEKRVWAMEWNGDDGGTYSMAEEAVTS